MNLLHISSDTTYLSIDSLDADTIESIRALIKIQGVVHWNNHGEVRIISNGVLSDVFDTYDFWSTAPDKWQASMPVTVGKIYWGDTHAFNRSLV